MTRRHRYDDEDDEDKRRIVPDGATVRVPLTMMDAMDEVQRSVAQHVLRITDADGGTAGLHRPGYRLPTHDANADERFAARVLYEARLQNEWRGTNSRKKRVKRDPRGRIVSEEEEFDDAAVPPLRDGMTLDEAERVHQQRMARSYVDYDNWIQQQWRNS